MSERPERMFFSERSLRIPLARFCAMRRFDVFNLPILPTGPESQTLKVSRYNFHKLTSSVPKWGLGIQGVLSGFTLELPKWKQAPLFSRASVPPAPGRHVCVPEPGGYGGSARAAVSSFHLTHTSTQVHSGHDLAAEKRVETAGSRFPPCFHLNWQHCRRHFHVVSGQTCARHHTAWLPPDC